MQKWDTDRLLKLAHKRGRPHQDKWNKICPVCQAKDIISLQIKAN